MSLIGQKSFAFGCDGNLIEISNDTNLASDNTIDSHNNSLDINESIELKQSPLEENIMLEHRYFSKNDKRLAKQLSFDTVDFPETDQLLEDNREIANSSNIAQNGTNVDNNEQEYNSFNTTPTKNKKHEFFDVRRASDGSCDTKSLKNKIFDGRRRFSDGAMRTIESQSMECTLIQKRRSLKRQSRVCDTTAIHYYEPISLAPNAIIECKIDNEEEISSDVTNSTHQLNVLKPLESTESKNLELKTDTESLLREPNYMSSLSKISETIDKMKRFETTEENSALGDRSYMQDNQAYCKDKICTDCKRRKNSDCRHVDKRKYWKKMKKIMRENKKLEDMLAKSRREVAEIRGMLSSVLSVRMEPGF